MENNKIEILKLELLKLTILESLSESEYNKNPNKYDKFLKEMGV